VHTASDIVMKCLATSFLVTFTVLWMAAPSALAQAGDLRTVPLVVMNSNGAIVQGLTAGDLRVRGVDARVQNLALDTGPRRIVLLFDNSGSMREGRHLQKWEAAKSAAKAFLKSLPAQDMVAVDVFADKETQIVPFTHDLASISSAIDALAKPGGRTNVGDALNSALLDAGSDLGFGACVVFFSDGDFSEDDSRRSLRSLIPDLGRNGVRVFLVLATIQDLPEQPDLSDELQFPGLRDTTNFVTATGGFSFAPSNFPRFSPPLQLSNASSLATRIAGLSNMVRGTYRVQLELEEPLRKKQRMLLEVIGNKSKPLGTLFLFYPRDLYPN
jgi:hypothetical protein